MGRITRTPPKAKPKYPHEVSVSCWDVDQARIWEEAGRVGGLMGYKTRRTGWVCTLALFDTQAKANEFARRLRRWREEKDRRKDRLRPCPIGVKYRRAALGQYAVTWGLSTGIIRDVVRAYRHARYDCSAHGPANMAAARVIIARCPHLDTHHGIDRARDMAEHMLVYAEARHRDWFWKGLEGDHSLHPFAFHK